MGSVVVVVDLFCFVCLFKYLWYQLASLLSCFPKSGVAS